VKTFGFAPTRRQNTHGTLVKFALASFMTCPHVSWHAAWVLPTEENQIYLSVLKLNGCHPGDIVLSSRASML
jgi:hypothetical protein